MTRAERILVVDDNRTNRTILVGSLGKAGYETREAADGFEAVELAEAWRPDLVLLDIGMPGRDGFEVCEILKSREETAATPVIFLTALSGSPEIQRAFAVGGADYVIKPFHMGEVKARVAVHLRPGEPERGPERGIGESRAPAVARAADPATRRGELLDALGEGAASEPSPDGTDGIATLLAETRRVPRPRAPGATRIDLPRAIERAIAATVLEWRGVAEVETELDPDLPPVACPPAELNRALASLLAIAAHGIADAAPSGSGGEATIRIRARRRGDLAEIRLGPEPGRGATFDLRLPLAPEPEVRRARDAGA